VAWLTPNAGVITHSLLTPAGDRRHSSGQVGPRRQALTALPRKVIAAVDAEGASVVVEYEGDDVESANGCCSTRATLSEVQSLVHVPTNTMSRSAQTFCTFLIVSEFPESHQE